MVHHSRWNKNVAERPGVQHRGNIINVHIKEISRSLTFVGGVPLLPLRNCTQQQEDRITGKKRKNVINEDLSVSSDIVDEAIQAYRLNGHFRHFEIQGHGDRLMVYLFLWIQDILAATLEAYPAWSGGLLDDDYNCAHDKEPSVVESSYIGKTGGVGSCLPDQQKMLRLRHGSSAGSTFVPGSAAEANKHLHLRRKLEHDAAADGCSPEKEADFLRTHLGFKIPSTATCCMKAGNTGAASSKANAGMTSVQTLEWQVLRAYLRQLRIELLARVFPSLIMPAPAEHAGGPTGVMVPSKWWMQYSKRKFLGLHGLPKN
ncbi:unnamed protein product [Amoebophrya sp. A120]|nr:unnamed protein product [Amoebophrya sp. A120]|eukprot:GSA120T00015426001.1